jgi:glc operon protein GlcG
MTDTVPHLRLTYAGATKILNAAIAKAEAMKQPQCITVCDDGGHILAFARMDGARVQSIDSSNAKARTAASLRMPTGTFEDSIGIKLGIATDGGFINLPGGLPIIVDGHVIGGVGVGSGTGEQDREVAKAALAALPGTKAW